MFKYFVSLQPLVVQICPDGFFASFPPLRQRAWATGLSTAKSRAVLMGCPFGYLKK
jgi:hypothetical protein